MLARNACMLHEPAKISNWNMSSKRLKSIIINRNKLTVRKCKWKVTSFASTRNLMRLSFLTRNEATLVISSVQFYTNYLIDLFSGIIM